MGWTNSLRITMVLAGMILGLAACESSTAALDRGPVSLSVTPPGPVELLPGETVQLAVSVVNSRSGAVAFSSSNPAVAPVSASGLITAASPGAATIRVTSVEDPNARAELLVQVVHPAFPRDTMQAAILLDSVTPLARAERADLDSIRGPVRVFLRLQRGAATRLEVLANDRVVCSQSFLSGARTAVGSIAALAPAPVEVSCEFDTARFDSVTGEPSFPNGPLAISARLLGARDSIKASAEPITVVLGNRSLLITRTTAARQAVGEDGRLWLGGAVTVVAVPVIYERGGQIETVRFSYAVPGADLALVHTDRSAPFEVTFSADSLPRAGGLRGLTDPQFRVTVASSTRGGAAGPQTVSPAVPYDNQAPSVGKLSVPDWVGATTEFRDLYSGGDDAGVGAGTVRFFAGDPLRTAGELIASGRAVRTGSDLEESGPGKFAVAALACDALANCAPVNGGVFGVDLVAPVIASLSSADRAINPPSSLTVSLSDDRSGFDRLPLLASTVRSFPGLPAAEGCGFQETPGVYAAGCMLERVALILPVEDEAGYYTYTLVAEDRAGNRSDSTVLTVLRDATPPTILGVRTPATFTGEVPIGIDVRDNLDLVEVSVRLVFPRPNGSSFVAVPLAPAQRVGAAFDTSLTPNAAVSASFPFVRTLTFAEGAAPRPTVLVDSLRVRAVDAAGGVAQLSRFIARSELSGTSTVDPFPGAVAVTSSVDNSQVCTVRCFATDPMSVTFSMQIAGEIGMRTPLQRLYLFVRSGSRPVELLGSSSSSSIVEVGNTKTVTYRVTYTPPVGLVGEFTLFAVGVREDHGLLSKELPVRLLAR